MSIAFTNCESLVKRIRLRNELFIFDRGICFDSNIWKFEQIIKMKKAVEGRSILFVVGRMFREEMVCHTLVRKRQNKGDGDDGKWTVKICLLRLFGNFQRWGSGWGSVGRAVASDTRGLQFESSHWQNLLNICLLSIFWIAENIEKDAGNGPFLKKIFGKLEITNV